MKSENGVIGFRHRLADIVGKEEPFAWAKRVGIPSATFDRMWNGGAVPKAETLLRISRSSDVSVDWLLTGEGAMRAGTAPPTAEAASPAPLDEELNARIVEAVARAYKEVGGAISHRDLGRVAAQIYNEIAAAGLESWDEKMGALALAAGQLRRRLQAPPAPASDAANSKRSA